LHLLHLLTSKHHLVLLMLLKLHLQSRVLRNCRENVSKVFHQEEQTSFDRHREDAIQNNKKSGLLAACICCGNIC